MEDLRLLAFGAEIAAKVLRIDADWLLAPREHLRQIFLTTLERVYASHVESGAAQDALAIARR